MRPGGKTIHQYLILACGLTAGAAAILTLAGRAEAIPAFARQYSTECKTCHTIFPERNEFGEAFEKNSFVWPGKTPPPKADPAKEKEGKNEALFLSGIPNQLPVSFLGNLEGSYNRDRTPKLDLFGTAEFEIFTAGSFQNKAGWFAEFAAVRDSEGETATEVGEVYIKFRNPFELPLAVKLGTFKPTLSLWKSNNRATIEKLAFANLTNGGNPFKPNNEKNGIELSQIFTPKFYGAIGALNSKNGDVIDAYLHGAVRIFGADFTGAEPKISLTSDSFTDYLTLTLGGYGYNGSWRHNADPEAVNVDYDNDFYRAGLESEIMFKALRVRLGTSWGQDDNLWGDGQTRKLHTFLGQAEYILGSNLLFAGRFEYLDKDQPVGTELHRILSPAITYTVLPNLKLMAEYVHDVGEGVTEDQGIASILFSF